MTRRTLLDLLEGPDPSRVALEALDRSPLEYGAWVRQVRGAAGLLRDSGLGPTDVAAVVLPNGPEMASVFLSTAVAGISAPLNPAYRREEFGFYLDDLQARALLMEWTHPPGTWPESAASGSWRWGSLPTPRPGCFPWTGWCRPRPGARSRRTRMRRPWCCTRQVRPHDRSWSP